jgi:hypothetical protein
MQKVENWPGIVAIQDRQQVQETGRRPVGYQFQLDRSVAEKGR